MKIFQLKNSHLCKKSKHKEHIQVIKCEFVLNISLLFPVYFHFMSILITLLSNLTSFSIHSHTYREYTSAGACTVICIYITYTMLPIRLQEAILGGILISISHITLLLHLHKMNTWNMVSDCLIEFYECSSMKVA